MTEPSMRDRMLAGELYIADDPDLIRENERAQRLTHAINTSNPTDRERRRELLTELLGGFGEDSGRTIGSADSQAS
ncbi:maltose acetyltransferase domain-containing protein [Mumia sp. ZJ1417]|uniref:maltose acetyltransferase domain-containing protein n=1 Tax=Mumia sp. ZJ1417 TaxID=2708082 RepID=UPI001AB02324|nr:maltose acetyltransferase domain-containing protein [Mumia sp. ZJ1417]